MINWESILSTFNNKPTLLQWLKLVQKALSESVLKNVETNTVDGKTKFIFNFADGTKIETAYIQTKGDTGAKGEKGDTGATGATGAKIIKTELIGQDGNGGNIYKQTFDDGETATFTAPKGAKGDKGDIQTLYHKAIIMDSTNLTAGDPFISLKLYFDMDSLSPVIYGDNATEKIPEQAIISRGFIRTKVTSQSEFIDYQLAYARLYHNGANTENKYTAEIAYWRNGVIQPITLRNGTSDIYLKVTKCTNNAYIDI